MDSNNILQKEFDRATEKLRKRLDNGEKVTNLTAAPEWEWYAESLRKTVEQTKNTLASKQFVNDHNGYLFAAAQVFVLEQLLANIETMKTQYVQASNKLNELEDAQNV